MPGALRVAAVVVALACGAPGRDASSGESASGARPPAADTPIALADTGSVTVNGLTLIGFHPVVSNDSLERDQDLATVLDDLAYHIGTAMDSLVARGVTVHYRGGRTVRLRLETGEWVFTAPADSADVGYLLVDAAGRRAVIYGVRTYIDLIEYVDEFRRTGRVGPG